MWRLVYLLLLLVRVYFALCPSYLHPDEIFQGPEPIAGVYILESVLLETVADIGRLSLPLSESQHLGMDIFPSYSQRLPIMAHIWLAYDLVEMDMGSRRRWTGRSFGHLLYSPVGHVRPQLCARGLGGL